MLRLVAAALVVVTALTGLVVLPVAPVAASSWPVTVGNSGENRPDTLMVHPSNGRVYVCDYDSVGDRSLLGLEPHGGQFMELPYESHRSDLCLNEWYDGNVATIGANGVTYGVKTSAYNGDFVIAYNGASELWATQLSSPCGANVYGIAGPMLAPDGTLYVVHDHYCGGRRAYLTRIDSSTGATIDTRELWQGQMGDDVLRQYDGGFAFRPQPYDGKFFFYRFDDLDNPSIYEPTFEPGEYFTGFWDVDPTTGGLYLTTGADQPCHGQDTMSSVVYYDGQSQTRHDLESACLMAASHLRVSPNGAVVAGAKPSYSTSPLNEGEAKVVFIDENGVTTKVLPDPPARKLWRPDEMRVDMHGNVLIARDYDIREDGSYTDHRHIDFLLYSASGTLLKRFTTETLKRDEWHNYQDVVLANGEFYALLQHGRVSGDYKVHRLPMALASYDYSRGTLLGVQSQPVEPLRYVALGDSYSSGEGVEPFLDGTATIDERCHRSELAYSKLLATDPTLPWAMTDSNFVACSGAVMSNITTTGQYPGMSPQITALSEDVDVVTLTIGGNDVGFGEFAKACVFGICAIGSEIYNETVSSINTKLVGPNGLEALYRQVLSAAPNAELYVIDYPHIVPSEENPTTTRCPYLQEGLGADARAAFDVTARISSAIESAVWNVQQGSDGNRLHFVTANGVGSSFEGHDVCSDDPYFHGVNITNPIYSFHPNHMGQKVYSEVIRASLS